MTCIRTVASLHTSPHPGRLSTKPVAPHFFDRDCRAGRAPDVCATYFGARSGLPSVCSHIIWRQCFACASSVPAPHRPTTRCTLPTTDMSILKHFISKASSREHVFLTWYIVACGGYSESSICPSHDQLPCKFIVTGSSHTYPDGYIHKDEDSILADSDVPDWPKSKRPLQTYPVR